MSVRLLRIILALPFVVWHLNSAAAFGRDETDSKPLLRYKEEGSFGSIRPNDIAKPAPTDMTPERHARAFESDSYADDSRSWGSEKPKYREIYEQLTKRQRASYSDEENLGVTIGIGLGLKTFSGSAGINFPLSRYAAWGLTAAYQNREEKEISSSRTSGQADLILQIPNPTPFTPFVTLGAGYESWRRAKDEGAGLEVFDQSASPTVNSSMGGSIRLARYVALVGAVKSTTFTADPPRVFYDNHRAAESRTDERFDLGIALMF